MSDEPKPDGDEPAKAQSPNGCLVAVVGVILLVVVASILGGDNEDSGGSADPDELEFAAFDVCTSFVKGRLRSPGSAKFRNYFEEDGEVVVTGFGDGPYVVRSSVDSENGFGALLRSRFVCTVTRNPATDKWRLDDLDLAEAGG